MHASAFVEETLGHDGLLGGQTPQFSSGAANVSGGFVGSGGAEAAFVDEEGRGVVWVGEDAFS